MRKKRETKLRANLKRKKKRANLIGYHEKAIITIVPPQIYVRRWWSMWWLPMFGATAVSLVKVVGCASNGGTVVRVWLCRMNFQQLNFISVMDEWN